MSFERWRADPVSFIESLIDPETGKPFRLLEAEVTFLEHALQLDEHGRLKHPELVFAAIKKSGKTAFAAMITLYVVLVLGGPYAEGYVLANDLEQSVGRVFTAIRRIVEMSPLLRSAASITASRIEFPELGATITALASDYAGAAGANPVISVFDELWAYVSERSRRLWDEMVPPPTRKIACRLTVSYAGFEGESALLEELYKRGLKQPQVGPSLHAGDGLLMAWHHEPIAPWQTPEWVEQMRSTLRTNAFLRMIENRFVSGESTFVDLDWWDRCVDADMSPVFADKQLAVWLGIDASVKRDSTAIVAVTWDKVLSKVRLVGHRIFQPTAAAPLDFERTVEATVWEIRERFSVRGVYYDPYQMAAVAQRLISAGVPMREYPQTPANLTSMGSNLYEMIKSRGIVVYPDEALRLAISRAVAVETPRGWKISKEKVSHKIDVVVALAMAARACVDEGQYSPVICAPIIVSSPLGESRFSHPGW